MAQTTLTVRQIMDLGLWEKVCEYQGWDSYIYNQGRIGEDDLVTFDSNFEKEKEEETMQLKTYYYKANHPDMNNYGHVEMINAFTLYDAMLQVAREFQFEHIQQVTPLSQKENERTLVKFMLSHFTDEEHEYVFATNEECLLY